MGRQHEANSLGTVASKACFSRKHPPWYEKATDNLAYRKYLKRTLESGGPFKLGVLVLALENSRKENCRANDSHGNITSRDGVGTESQEQKVQGIEDNKEKTTLRWNKPHLDAYRQKFSEDI